METPDAIAEIIQDRRIVLAGCSGLVGQRLHAALRELGAETLQLIRHDGPGSGEAQWDPAIGRLPADALDGADAVVNLAGASIMKRWTDDHKKAIRQSRIDATETLAERIAEMDRPPALINASAVGYYGCPGDEALDEESPPGDDFLAGVCRDWEAATKPVSAVGARVVILRFGVVLDPRGGALGKALLPFKLGLGGRIGSGQQIMSWIAWDDLVQIILRAIADSSLQGAYNATAPLPVTNRDFTRALGRALHRPTLFPVPGFLLRLLFGQLADDLLLDGQKVLPARLTEAGFDFASIDIDTALDRVLDDD